MKLLNVRLTDGDAAKVATLRRQGVKVSELVRQAIRDAYAKRRVRRGRKESAAEILARLDAAFPTPPAQERERIDLTDRHAVRAAFVKSLKRKRPA